MITKIPKVEARCSSLLHPVHYREKVVAEFGFDLLGKIELLPVGQRIKAKLHREEYRPTGDQPTFLRMKFLITAAFGTELKN